MKKERQGNGRGEISQRARSAYDYGNGVGDEDWDVVEGIPLPPRGWHIYDTRPITAYPLLLKAQHPMARL